MAALPGTSGIFRRSNLGSGCYIVRDDGGRALPDAETAIYDAVPGLDAGAGGYAQSVFDPRISDSFFWQAETTSVHDSTGNWLLTPDGELKPASRR